MQQKFSIESQEYKLHVVSMLNEISDEHLKILTHNELEKYKPMISNSRRKEFITSRLLLKSMLHENYSPIQYEESGKPSMKSLHLSLSHSKNFVAAITSITHNVAVDIEQYRESILKIAYRFMSKQEEKDFVGIENITLLWSAKEVLYKMFNASPDFQEHYSVTHIQDNGQSGIVLGHVCTEKFEKVIELSYFRNSEFCLVWANVES